jgi:hypothetical protein
MTPGERLARSHVAGTKVAAVLQKRTQLARERLTTAVSDAGKQVTEGGLAAAAFDPTHWAKWAVDSAQRQVLFLDTLWQRGNNYLAHNAEGLSPVLHFAHETVLDGRTFDRPVNYALLRIVPPAGVTVDPQRRPYVIIDPRAGHGPGIGGFKDDSQVGVALRGGHPVYFVVFFRDPEPGQTLLDVCEAERRFVREVRRLHPKSAKPAIVGNCQGGWAAMMLAASDPDDMGPIVINGAPMSYWSGAWTAGEGDNPMRYSGGLLGGTWLSSFSADLGNGRFDGAHLVKNFENLNPANTFWDKYFHLYDQADTEPPRFLEFERWWGGYYLMNRDEIEWITRNLFVGNQLWSGGVKGLDGAGFDLRNIKSPIVLFASMGDNITPPQQAFNWVVDVYRSTEEIKARGQVIVGLQHESIGHLGIFVSGKVAKKEHNQIVSVLKSIERLPPGLYRMTIHEREGGGEPQYDVEFDEHRLEDIAAAINRFDRVDEKPFEAVAEVSDLNQRAYELFAQPWVQAFSNEFTATLGRELHPLRMRNWAFSRLNPFLSWIAPAAEQVRAHRQALDADDPLRRGERVAAGLVSAGLDHYRAMRDATTEAGFFSIYANLFSLYAKDEAPVDRAAAATAGAQPYVDAALAAIGQGGYLDALARIAALLQRDGAKVPLSRLELRNDLAKAYAAYFPEVDAHAWHLIRGRQDIIVHHAAARALETLPDLLAQGDDRARTVELIDKLASDPRLADENALGVQLAVLARIRAVLAEGRALPAPAKVSRAADAAKPKAAKTPTRRTTPAPRRKAAA